MKLDGFMVVTRQKDVDQCSLVGDSSQDLAGTGRGRGTCPIPTAGGGRFFIHDAAFGPGVDEGGQGMHANTLEGGT